MRGQRARTWGGPPGPRLRAQRGVLLHLKRAWKLARSAGQEDSNTIARTTAQEDRTTIGAALTSAARRLAASEARLETCAVSGPGGPQHHCADYGPGGPHHDRVAHSTIGAALTSAARRLATLEACLETCAVSGPGGQQHHCADYGPGGPHHDRGRAHERSEASYYIRSVLENLRGLRARRPAPRLRGLRPRRTATPLRGLRPRRTAPR